MSKFFVKIIKTANYFDISDLIWNECFNLNHYIKVIVIWIETSVSYCNEKRRKRNKSMHILDTGIEILKRLPYWASPKIKR